MKSSAMPHRHQSGFSLIELMVAAAIAMFMLLAFTVVFINMKTTLTAQDQLAQLQDNERLALSILTTTLQSAGYIPDAGQSAFSDSLPATSDGTFAAEQGIAGGVSGTNDKLSVRYVTASGDGLMDCLGLTNTSGANATVINTFTVSASNELMCSPDGGVTAATPLISNVSSLSVLYGLDTSAANNSTGNRYLTAAAVTAAASWQKVKTVRLTIAFVNPYSTTKSPLPAISWVQTINLMNKT